MQCVHFQVGVGVFNCQQILTKISFVIFNIVGRYKTNRMWLSVVCILIDNELQVITVDKICCETIDLFMYVDISKIHGNLNGFLVTFSTIFTSYL